MKKDVLKKWLAEIFIIAVISSIFLLAEIISGDCIVRIYAEENSALDGEEVVQDIVKDYVDIEKKYVVDLETVGDNDELLMDYLQISAKSSNSQTYPSNGRKRLTGINKQLYDILRGYIKRVADGDLNETTFVVPLKDLDLTKLFTAEELEVDDIFLNGEVTPEAANALAALINKMDLDSVMTALLFDCPFDLYWYDKVVGVSSNSSLNSTIVYDDTLNEYRLGFDEDTYFSFSFAVAGEYAINNMSGCFEIDTNIIGTVHTAINQAKFIVSKHTGNADYLKLLSYKNAICEYVDYNFEVANDNSAAYGNPWQIIWVFDGDMSTNVVCEGYSKAFQYLCDLTEFSGDISCNTVTGTMTGGTGQGPHMWNIVNMEDGKNYFVDITNSDDGSLGAPDKLFLAGHSSGNVNTGYSIACGETEIKYIYSDQSFLIYDNTELEISSERYIPKNDANQVWAQGSCGENVRYVLTADGTITINGSGPMVSISYWQDLPFKYFKNVIKKVIIKYGVTDVGFAMFMGCENLISVSLPNSITEIKEYAFNGCTSLTEITLPDSLKLIRGVAFSNCIGLTSITFPRGIEEIGVNAFSYCTGLKEVLGTENVRYLGSQMYIFKGCVNLQDENGFVIVKDVLFDYYGSGGDIIIPDTVKTISGEAFNGCKTITSVIIPDSVEVIQNRAFAYCTNLTSVILPSSLNDIYSNFRMDAFTGCTGLASEDGFVVINGILFAYYGNNSIIEIPNNVHDIGSEVFMECDTVKEVTIPSNVSTIGTSAFKGCPNLVKLTIKDDIRIINYEAFSYCPKLSSVTINGDVEYLAEDSFQGCPELADSNGFVIVKDTLFGYYGNSRNIVVPDGVRVIGFFVFSGNSVLESIVLPEGVEDIFDMAFLGCSSLNKVDFPHSLKIVRNSVFMNCNNLTNVVLPHGIKYIFNDAFGYTMGANAPDDGFTISGYCGTVAEEYASKSNIQFIDISSTGKKIEPTCTKPGCINCPVCGTKIKDLPSPGHKYEIVEGSAVAATCEKDGKEADQKCERCDAVITGATIGKLGHKYGDWKTTKEPTCTEIGSKEKVCADCNDKVTEEIPAKGHTWKEEYTVDKPASCSEEGSESIHCSVCSAIKEDSSRTIDKIPHNYGDWTTTKEATCTEKGSKEKVCADCKDKVTEEIPAKGHTWKEEYTVDKPASCSEEGSESIHCSVCSAIKEDSSRTIDKTPHNYGDWTTTKEPTCTVVGSKEKVCADCNDKVTEEIPAKGHSPEVIPAVAPTCSKTGLTEGSRCSVCKEILKAQKNVAVTGKHTWDKGKVTKTPTALSTGTKTYTCTVCKKATKNETLKKLTPTIKLYSGKKIIKEKKIKAKQYFTLTISKLAKGDSVKSVKSGKKGIVKIKKIKKNNYRITGLKKGKTIVTVTLKSGKTATCVVTVK